MVRSIIVAAFIVTATACAGSRELQDPANALPQNIYVEAVNDHFYDVRIHAVYAGGQRRTLGTIGGNGGETESTILWEPHALVFYVDFIVSGARYVSIPVDVSRGEVIAVRIPPNIDQSGFFRRLRSN